LSAETALTVAPELCKRAQAILKTLKDNGLSIVTAESCTAGMIAAVLSRADGASDILHGGFVIYTKAHKHTALGVSRELLRDRGAVNEEVVKHLATGALRRSPASFSLAVSGVLGPEEDEDGNPVGLVYFCCAKSGAKPIVVREEFGKKKPEELLQLTIARASTLSKNASACPPPHRNCRKANAPFLHRARCLGQIARAARRDQIGQGVRAALTQGHDMVA
jgi:nicotinamide-nucleotide amidase